MTQPSTPSSQDTTVPACRACGTRTHRQCPDGLCGPCCSETLKPHPAPGLPAGTLASLPHAVLLAVAQRQVRESALAWQVVLSADALLSDIADFLADPTEITGDVLRRQVDRCYERAEQFGGLTQARTHEQRQATRGVQRLVDGEHRGHRPFAALPRHIPDCARGRGVEGGRLPGIGLEAHLPREQHRVSRQGEVAREAILRRK
jgi:hypothetical protein